MSLLALWLCPALHADEQSAAPPAALASLPSVDIGDGRAAILSRGGATRFTPDQSRPGFLAEADTVVVGVSVDNTWASHLSRQRLDAEPLTVADRGCEAVRACRPPDEATTTADAQRS